MYVDYYNLQGFPFRLNPDHRFFYVAGPHEKAVAHLDYALNQGEGFVVITGEVGAGKTTLVNHMLSDLKQSGCVAGNVVTTCIEHEDLVRLVADAFDVDQEGADKVTLLLNIRTFLEEQHEIGRRPVLFVDEVQNLPESSLEELRMLSNFSLPGRSLIQIFLVGQPQFKDILADPNFEQLRQRIITSCHLGALSEDETRNYILHRLLQAGWKDDPTFSDEAFHQIHRLSGGLPRRINLLCDRLLLLGYLEDLHRIDEDAVASVLKDMTEEGLITAAILNPDPEDHKETDLQEEPGGEQESKNVAETDEPAEDEPELTAGEEDALEAVVSEVASSRQALESGAEIGEDAAAPQDVADDEPSSTAPAETPAQPSKDEEASDIPGQTQPPVEPVSDSAEVIELDAKRLPSRQKGVRRYALAAAVVLAIVGLPSGLWTQLLQLQSGADKDGVSYESILNKISTVAGLGGPDEEIEEAETGVVKSDSVKPDMVAPTLKVIVQDEQQSESGVDGSYLIAASTDSSESVAEQSKNSLAEGSPVPENAALLEAIEESVGTKGLQTANLEVPVADDTNEDRFLIQLAALRTSEKASQMREKLQLQFAELLGGMALGIQEADLAGLPYFRILTDESLGRNGASRICAELKSAGQDCIIMLQSSAGLE
ncbi:XrtA/PEP-CTERM system-associated ATPase [Pelagibius sp. Alg239-R121]|uniref:XrtA/PEP-CTERM system-associated ATPase n=1 Tax=Pelagibius sp. Alg239-R121 TaxID=2993448 RepID=UPI0024A67D93|nr:XrtA/PEP-CTERM system-associated ATPase [Pelagibius sp. Alg239-R121]